MLDALTARLAPAISSRASRYHWLWLLSRDSGAVFGGLTVVSMALLGVLGPSFTGYDVLKVDPMNRLLPPSSSHLLGTDGFGRDMLTRVLFGARISLLVGLATTFCTTILGAGVGLVAGYFTRVDGPIMRVMDGFMAFPGLAIAGTVLGLNLLGDGLRDCLDPRI